MPDQINESERVRILDFPVDNIRMSDAINRIQEFVETGRPHLVITADASALVIAHDDPDFHQIIQKADLVTPDGSGMIWAAHRKGISIEERVSGVDLVNLLCRIGSQKGQRFYFLGSAPGIAQAAADKLMVKYPGLNVVGTHDGFFTTEEIPQLVNQIASLKPHYLFTALGIPKQEKFLWENKDQLQVPVMMGVGGTFDVYSGHARRAPKIFQKLYLEWLWRVLLNPKKISKVKLLPAFVKLVLNEERNRKSK